MGVEINFLLTGDKNYVNQIIVTMTSIIENMPNSKLWFHIFEGGMNDNDINKLKKIEINPNVSLTVYPMDSYEHYFSKLCPEKSINAHVSKAGNYRLLMTKVLPDTVKKCFYVDSDVIVDTDLSEIYNSLKSDELAIVVSEIAVMEYREDTLRHWYRWEEFSDFVKNPIKHPHFNDGFFLLNVEYARFVNIFDKIIEFVDKYDYFPYTDQDVMNAVVGQGRYGKVRLLSPHYDVFWDTDHYKTFKRSCYSSETIADAFKNPKIVHFCGSWKPWDCGAWHHYELWWKYAKKSISADYFFVNNKRELSDISHDAMRYYYGWGVEKDLKKSMDCIMKIVDAGIKQSIPFAIDIAKELNDNQSLHELFSYVYEQAVNGEVKGNVHCVWPNYIAMVSG